MTNSDAETQEVEAELASAERAGLRLALVLLTIFMLSEAVLSVERTGLP